MACNRSSYGIKTGCCNIQGMNDSKTQDPSLVSFINQNDFSIFFETWSSKVMYLKKFIHVASQHVKVYMVDLKVV